LLLSEIQMKEVVVLESGKRLGYIQDIEIAENSGAIQSFIISDRQLRGAFFQKQEERKVMWDQIVTIGADIILVKAEKKEKENSD